MKRSRWIRTRSRSSSVRECCGESAREPDIWRTSALHNASPHGDWTVTIQKGFVNRDASSDLDDLANRSAPRIQGGLKALPMPLDTNHAAETTEVGGNKPDKGDKPDKPEKPDKGDKGSKAVGASGEGRSLRATGDKSDAHAKDKLGLSKDSTDRTARASALKEMLDTIEDSFRDFVCKVAFGSKDKPEKEPRLDPETMTPTERASDWLGLDSFVTDKPVGNMCEFVKDVVGAVEDFRTHVTTCLRNRKCQARINYRMNTGKDKFYHCRANSEANLSRARRGHRSAAMI